MRVSEVECEQKKNVNRCYVESEYGVDGSVLDELGLDRQAALELKLKVGLHQKILQLVKRRGPNQGQRRRTRVSDPHELMCGKISTLSVARLLLYADLLGAEAEVSCARLGGHCCGLVEVPQGLKPTSLSYLYRSALSAAPPWALLSAKPKVKGVG